MSLDQLPPNGKGVSAHATVPAHRRRNSTDPLVPTIFHTPWWLNAASNGAYDQVEIASGGRIVARLPYIIRSPFPGLTMCAPPQLCHSLGPAIDLGQGHAVNQGVKHYQLTQQLIATLPQGHDCYRMALHAGTPDTFAFTDAGYDTGVQFTFEIEPQHEPAIWQGMRDKTRNVIRRAQERWEVTVGDDPAEFCQTYERNLRVRGLDNHYDHIELVCTAAIANGAGRILAVRGPNRSLVGAVFIVWDQHAMYYLLATRDVAADNGVMSLLVWHAIRMAAAAGRVFDFDNVGQPGSRVVF